MSQVSPFATSVGKQNIVSVFVCALVYLPQTNQMFPDPKGGISYDSPYRKQIMELSTVKLKAFLGVHTD